MTELSSNCIDRQIAGLSRLHYVIKTQTYQDILDEIIAVAKDDYTRRVLIAGVGKNANIASKISETMASLGIPSMPLNISHCAHGDYGYVGPFDIIIHISRSGQTAEMLEAMEHIAAIRPSVKQILIHCKRDKKPNQFAFRDLFIGDVAEGDKFGLAPTTSTTVLLCILDCLSVEASDAIGFVRMDFLKLHPGGALGKMLKEEKNKTAVGEPVEGIPIFDPTIAKLNDSTAEIYNNKEALANFVDKIKNR